MIRLQKYLADCGVAARRKAEELIVAGRVTVNGEIVAALGVKIDPKADTVAVDGKTIRPEKLVTIMLHKPEGFVTTASDDRGRPTVMELIRDVRERLSPVGRLDYSTSGMLLMTNDGELLFNLTHPRREVEKTYIVRVVGVPSDESLRRLRRGVMVDHRLTAPARVGIIRQTGIARDTGTTREKGPTRQTGTVRQTDTANADGANASLRITIHEGRNRQVRKMCEAIGHDVLHLKRVATGKLTLGDLPKGKYRYLTREEIQYLKDLSAPPADTL